MQRTGAGVFHAATAVAWGDVTLGAGCSLWPGASIRGDVAAVTLGTRCNVQDNASVHCVHREPQVIGDDVSIGHNAVVHGRAVGDGTLIGMHATVLGGVVIGRGCLVAAGALLPEGARVPDGHVAMGLPATPASYRPLREAERAYIAKLPPHYLALAEAHEAGAYPSVL